MSKDLLKNPDLEPRCLFCSTENPKLVDVLKDDPIKKYNDSPYNTIKSESVRTFKFKEKNKFK